MWLTIQDRQIALPNKNNNTLYTVLPLKGRSSRAQVNYFENVVKCGINPSSQLNSELKFGLPALISCGFGAPTAHARQAGTVTARWF